MPARAGIPHKPYTYEDIYTIYNIAGRITRNH
jgi:hypothetical protein